MTDIYTFYGTRNFIRFENLKRIKTRSTGEYKYTSSMISHEEVVTSRGHFEMTINVASLLQWLTQKAARNSTGVAKYLGGDIVVRKVSEKEVSRESRDYPMLEGFEELES